MTKIFKHASSQFFGSSSFSKEHPRPVTWVETVFAYIIFSTPGLTHRSSSAGENIQCDMVPAMMLAHKEINDSTPKSKIKKCLQHTQNYRFTGLVYEPPTS